MLLLPLILNLGEKNQIFLPDVFDGVLCFCHHKFVDPLMYLHAIKVLYRQAYFNTTPLLDNLDGMRESQPFTASIQSGRKIRYPLCRGGVSFPNYSKCLGWDLDEGLPPPPEYILCPSLCRKGDDRRGRALSSVFNYVQMRSSLCYRVLPIDIAVIKATKCLTTWWVFIWIE